MNTARQWVSGLAQSVAGIRPETATLESVRYLPAGSRRYEKSPVTRRGQPNT